jgi:hypothetical protein
VVIGVVVPVTIFLRYGGQVVGPRIVHCRLMISSKCDAVNVQSPVSLNGQKEDRRAMAKRG